MAHYELKELYYSEDRGFPLRLYVYDRMGYYRTAPWFSPKVKYPDEEITVEEARKRAEAGVKAGLEVRITNGDDFLVFHAKDGKVIYPAEGAEAFWRSLETK